MRFYAERSIQRIYYNYRISIIFIFFFVLIAKLVFAASYYVDATTGNDNNSGLSEPSAFKTLDKVQSFTFLPGDIIFFKRGEKWEGTIDFLRGGNESAPITFGAYGNGDKPLLSNVRSIVLWSNVATSIYFYSAGGEWCYGLFEDGKKLKEASSVSLADGNWYFNRTSKLIFYKPTSGKPSDHLLQYAPLSYLIRLNASYVDIENLSLQYAGGGIVANKETKYINIRRCELGNFYERGISFYNTLGNCSAVENIINKCGDGIYFIHDKGNDIGNHNLILGNKISYCNYNEYNNNDGHAIGIQDSNYNVISHNEIEYCRAPIAIWARSGMTTDNNVIKYNIIANCKGEFADHNAGVGIAICPNSDNGAKGNKVYYNIIKKCNYGMKFKHSNFPGNEVYNNVIYNCNEGLKLSIHANHLIFKNNIIAVSKDLHVNSEHDTNGTENIFDFNCYYPLPHFKFRSKLVNNFEAWHQTSNQDAHSFASDPAFVDTSTFKLKSDSPCINAGVNVGLFNDIWGRELPLNGKVDIGACEYQLKLGAPNLKK